MIQCPNRYKIPRKYDSLEKIQVLQNHAGKFLAPSMEVFMIPFWKKIDLLAKQGDTIFAQGPLWPLLHVDSIAGIGRWCFIIFKTYILKSLQTHYELWLTTWIRARVRAQWVVMRFSVVYTRWCAPVWPCWFCFKPPTWHAWQPMCGVILTHCHWKCISGNKTLFVKSLLVVAGLLQGVSVDIWLDIFSHIM